MMVDVFSRWDTYLYYVIWIYVYVIDAKTKHVDPESENCGNSTHIKCCNGFYLKDSECQECPAGTFGLNCTSECPDGFYGVGCKSKCDCPVTERCDKSRGCVSVVRTCLTPECTNGTLFFVGGNGAINVQSTSNPAAVAVPILIIIIVICILAVWIKLHGYNRVAMLRKLTFWRPTVMAQVNSANNDTTRCRVNDDIIYDDIRESRMILDACTSSGIRRNNSNDDGRYQDVRFLKLKAADHEVEQFSPYSKCDSEESGTYCKLAHDGQKAKPTFTQD